MTESAPTPSTDRFARAVALAAEVHRGQTRKATDAPYVSHLLAVAALVLDDGGDEDEAIAGLLHDAVEDSGEAMEVMLAGIRAGFGDRVAGLVAAATDVDVHAGVQRAAVRWSARKQRIIDTLADADASTGRVLLAAELDNVRAILTGLAEHGPQVWDRFNAGRDDQLWYYAALSASAGQQRSSRLARQFGRAVEQLEQAAYARTAPHNPSDWDAGVAPANPCGARHYIHGARCGRPGGHGGLHAYSPRPGDL